MVWNQTISVVRGRYNAPVVYHIADTGTLYEKIVPLFDPLFSKLGNVHGVLRGDNDLVTRNYYQESKNMKSSCLYWTEKIYCECLCMLARLMILLTI